MSMPTVRTAAPVSPSAPPLSLEARLRRVAVVAVGVCAVAAGACVAAGLFVAGLGLPVALACGVLAGALCATAIAHSPAGRFVQQATGELADQRLVAERLQTIAQRHGSAVLLTDREGHIEWVNEAFCRITGFSPDEARAQTGGLLFVGDESPPSVTARVEHAIASAEGFSERLCMSHKTGRTVWLEADAQSILGADGRPRGLVVFARDVSEEVMRTAGLGERLERLEGALHALDRGVFDWNLAAGAVTVDARQSAIFGLDPARRVVTADEWQRCVVPEDAEAAFESLQRALRGESDYTARLRVRTPSGEERPVELCGRVIRDLSGKATRLVGTTVDATATARADAERTRLETEVATSIDALAHEAHQAQLRARAESQARTAYYAELGHALRAPLVAILGAVDLLSTRGSGASYDALYRATIDRNADEVLEALDALRDHALLESRALVVERAPCAPALLVQEALVAVQPLAEAKGLTLDVHFDASLPETVHTDAARLGQVVRAVLEHAIAQTPFGAIGVHVVADAQSDTLRVEIKDGSDGLDEVAIARLFEPFAPGAPPGSTLALRNARGLAELLGGGLTITSAPKLGSRYAVRIASGVAVEAPVPVARESDTPQLIVSTTTPPHGFDSHDDVEISGVHPTLLAISVPTRVSSIPVLTPIAEALSAELPTEGLASESLSEAFIASLSEPPASNDSAEAA